MGSPPQFWHVFPPLRLATGVKSGVCRRIGLSMGLQLGRRVGPTVSVLQELTSPVFVGAPSPETFRGMSRNTSSFARTDVLVLVWGPHSRNIRGAMGKSPALSRDYFSYGRYFVSSHGRWQCSRAVSHCFVSMPLCCAPPPFVLPPISLNGGATHFFPVGFLGRWGLVLLLAHGMPLPSSGVVGCPFEPVEAFDVTPFGPSRVGS